MVAAGARESMILTVIHIDLDLRPGREMRLDPLDRLERDELILIGEMHDHRAFDLAGFIQRLIDADAIVADRRIDFDAAGGEISKLAAEAEAERTDLAG